MKIKVNYKSSPGYHPLLVSGAIGGVNPQGQLVINFYRDETPLPVSQILEVDEKGKILSETREQIEQTPEMLTFDRVIRTGIIISYEDAKGLHAWLGNHLATLKVKFDKE